MSTEYVLNTVPRDVSIGQFLKKLLDVLVSELWRGEFCTSRHFTNKYTLGDVTMFVKSDLIEKFN